MPRAARRLSGTNLYHVMLRGNEQRQIFRDEEDNLQFIRMLDALKVESGFHIYAYCLMGNHVHLLIRTGENGEPLSMIFRRLGTRYVFWYNGKYRRVGHLFQDRYRSEVVEDDSYMLSALRYIHRNPVKAGIARDMAEHPYSSYREYLEPKAGQLTDIEFINGMMDREGFIAFHEQPDDAKIMDIKPVRPRLSDEQAKRIIEKASGCGSVEEFQSLSREKRMSALKELKVKNISYRQLSRLTGESVGMIQSIV